MLSAADKILRSVRGTDTVFGGVFLAAVGDHYQCPAVDDTMPVLRSMLVRHNFDVFQLHHLFRSRTDPTLQHLIRSIRQPRLSLKIQDDALRDIRDRCHFVRTREEVPADARWFLPTHVAVNVCRAVLVTLRHTPRAQCIAHWAFRIMAI